MKVKINGKRNRSKTRNGKKKYHQEKCKIEKKLKFCLKILL